MKRDEGDAARRAQRDATVPDWDRPAAVSLLVDMVPMVAILFVVSRLNETLYACGEISSCSQPMMSLGAWMLEWLPIFILLGSVIITGVVWRRRQRVLGVALVALILTGVVFVVSNLLLARAW